MSQTMAEALRTTYCVPQTGSKLARSACGTNRSVRAAARCEIAGVAKEPATDKAPAPAADFRNVLRSMMGSLRLPCRAAYRAGEQVACRDASDSDQRGPSRWRFAVNGINKRPVFNIRELALLRKRRMIPFIIP